MATGDGQQQQGTRESSDAERIVRLLERLTGEAIPFVERLKAIPFAIDSRGHRLGYSQLNEVLLVSGLDRVTSEFFSYLLDGSTDYEIGAAFESLDQLEAGITRFRKMALLRYGNTKFAFKSLSRDADLLERDLAAGDQEDSEQFEKRHEPVLSPQAIAPEDAYLTGYIIEGELKTVLKANPDDAQAVALETRRGEIVDIAVRNQEAYYASDHLDVYVATSMRARHEFISIARIVKEIFDHESIKPLNLRWFDPTQAYCRNRIDKGLAEALMLKRAKCTIYLAQESDTLGKDSELASTLAQGKPVIAFVPEVDEKYLREHFKALSEAEPEKTNVRHLLEQLKLFDPDAAWEDPEVRGWCASPDGAPMELLEKRVHAKIQQRFNSRATALREIHPLGIQVNLGTGVANGVMVVRTTDDCARLIRGIVTNSLDFRLDEQENYTALRETISGSIFRVMTSDAMLTNTFWNFYLNPTG